MSLRANAVKQQSRTLHQDAVDTSSCMLTTAFKHSRPAAAPLQLSVMLFHGHTRAPSTPMSCVAGVHRGPPGTCCVSEGPGEAPLRTRAPEHPGDAEARDPVPQAAWWVGETIILSGRLRLLESVQLWSERRDCDVCYISLLGGDQSPTSCFPLAQKKTNRPLPLP
jgi:hypothetical protein